MIKFKPEHFKHLDLYDVADDNDAYGGLDYYLDTNKLAQTFNKMIEDKNKQFNIIVKYLEWLANMDSGTVWTERDWREANEVLLVAHLMTGKRTEEELYD